MTIPAIKKILLPVDFSDGSTEAAYYAVSLAQKLNASIDVLYVMDFPHQIGIRGATWVTPQMIRDAEEVARAQLSSFTKELGLDSRGTYHLENKVTNVASAICDYVDKNFIDCIVIAKHSRSALNRMLMGSVTEKVVRMSTCPVFMVPTFLN